MDEFFGEIIPFQITIPLSCLIYHPHNGLELSRTAHFYRENGEAVLIRSRAMPLARPHGVCCNNLEGAAVILVSFHDASIQPLKDSLRPQSCSAPYRLPPLPVRYGESGLLRPQDGSPEWPQQAWE